MYEHDTRERRLINSSKDIVGYLIFIFIFLVFLGLAIYFSRKQILDTVVTSLNYQESADLGYRVYYEENPFYTDPYLLEGKTYIAKYINKVDMDFSYLVNYDDTLAGSYDFFVRAKLLAYKPGERSEELWSRDYQILDTETISFNNQDGYKIDKTISLEYQKYKAEYDNYREGTAISSEGVLIVELVVRNHGSYKDLDDFNYESALSLEIPVSDETFRITDNNQLDEEVKSITKSESATFERTLITIIAALLWIITVLVAVSGVSYYIVNRRKISYYERKLKKILDTYDPIIVNVENLPSLTNLNVVDVTTFEELVDAQNEVRLPINFMENKKKKVAKFILIKDKLAWVYTLKEGDANN